MSNLRDWKKVFPLEASHLQEPVDALRRLNTIIGGRGVSVSQTSHGTTVVLTYPDQIIGEFLGVTTATGPDGANDWTDSRVWVNPILIDIAVGADANTNSLISLFSVPPQDENGSASSILKPVCAINLADVAGGGHSLTAGTPVQVLAMLDQQNPPNVHFLIASSGGSGASTGAGQKKGMVLTDVTDNSTGFDYVRIVKTY